MKIATLLAVQLLAVTAGSAAADPRPAVKVVFQIRPDHPYTLNFGDVGDFEKIATGKLVTALEKVKFIKFSADEGEHTLYLLLDDRHAGVADEDLREIWLFADVNEEATRDDAKMTWEVRGAGTDNTSIGNAGKFSDDIANAVRNGDLGLLIANCFRDIDLAKRARKPAMSSYWMMPFHIRDLKVGERSVFDVVADQKYEAEPHELPEPLAEAKDEYAGKTVTVTRGTPDVLQSLQQRGRIDATRVRMNTYVAPTKGSQSQQPAGTKPKKKS
jgi:hypothetical protein